jgi:DNA-directed RNA polymerase specialized sigma24 family protein
LCDYLAAAVRHKIQTRTRKERRHAGSLPDDLEPVSPEPQAAQQAEDQDFCQAIRARLSGEKRLLFDLKSQGLTWTEISEKIGGQPDALRMRLSRAVAAVLGELGQEELSHAP